jgi:tetratricopeptide (TPR) repeat protein
MRADAERRYQIAKDAHQRFLDEMAAYPMTAAYRDAVIWFDQALKQLEDRGLLQWDRAANSYDMHPVVRAYAAEQLDERDKTATYDKIRDHFASLPPENLHEATELIHVKNTIEIYRALVGAGRIENAVRHYKNDLAHALYFHIGAYAVVLELLKPLFDNDLDGMPCQSAANDQSYLLGDLANVHYAMGHADLAIRVCEKQIKLNVARGEWSLLEVALRTLHVLLASVHRRAESVIALELARELTQWRWDPVGEVMAMYLQMVVAVQQGRFDEADKLDGIFHKRRQPPTYVPGEAEYLRCKSLFFRGQLTETDWQYGYDLAVRHRNVLRQHGFLALRGEWELNENRAEPALEFIEQALQVALKTGAPAPRYHDLRAWALACLGRAEEARASLQNGSGTYQAARAHLALGDREQSAECSLNAYRWAWGEGPPHIEWYYLNETRKLLAKIGVPEPQLPPFDMRKVPAIPEERKIRAAIASLRAECAKR